MKITELLKLSTAVLALGAFSAVGLGCESFNESDAENAAEDVGEGIEDAADATGDAIGDAYDSTADAVEDAAD